MRVIADIPHEGCKITVFAWNSRYIIKMERGLLEQTYKIDEFELSSIDDINKLLDETFMQQVMTRFTSMHSELQAALNRV
jgi:hypothetical protein